MKQGLFEVAQGGTIFLDEIGDMPLDVQTKLLNVLENRRMRRVGGTREHLVEVRIIAATNRNLGESVRAERFRSDLYYRLKVVSIQLPALRERGDDVLLLAEHFLKRYRRKYGKPDLELNDDVRSKLLNWHWPGNVRELAHAMEHLILVSDGQTLRSPQFLADPTVTSPGPSSTEPGSAPSSGLQFDFDNGDCTLEGVERILIEAALAHTRGNVSEVARILGVSRGALRHRMDKWGIRP